MQNSNAVVKKIYCVVVNGEVQEKLDFDNIENSKRLYKTFQFEVPPRKYDCYSRNVPNKYRYHYKGDLPECGLKIK